MTPSKRVSFERMQISVKPTDETTNKEGKDEDLGKFTIRETHNHNHDNIIGLTEKFRTICWSPASCDSLGGCLLAVMTNIGTVKVFGFKGNSSTSEHLEIFSTAPPTQPEHPRVTSKIKILFNDIVVITITCRC